MDINRTSVHDNVWHEHMWKVCQILTGGLLSWKESPVFSVNKTCSHKIWTDRWDKQPIPPEENKNPFIWWENF